MSRWWQPTACNRPIMGGSRLEAEYQPLTPTVMSVWHDLPDLYRPHTSFLVQLLHAAYMMGKDGTQSYQTAPPALSAAWCVGGEMGLLTVWEGYWNGSLIGSTHRPFEFQVMYNRGCHIYTSQFYHTFETMYLLLYKVPNIPLITTYNHK